MTRATRTHADLITRTLADAGVPLAGWCAVAQYEARFPDAGLARYVPGARSVVVFGSPMLAGAVDTLALGTPPFIDAWYRRVRLAGLLPLARNPAYLVKQLVKGRTSAFNQRYHLHEHLEFLTEENNRLAYLVARRLEAAGERALPVDPCKRHYFPLRGVLSLKHAAVMAGLGVMGRHRQLVTPAFGTRVWLGGLLTTAELPAPPRPAGRFAPCTGCDACVQACPRARPRGAFTFAPHDCTLCSCCLEACVAPRR